METVCKPHMLSEYPLGYSRLTYETEDPIAAVEAAGYFGPAAPVLRVRDIIEVWAAIESRQPEFRTYAVTRADAGGMVVDITPVEKIARRRVRKAAADSAPASDSAPTSAPTSASASASASAFGTGVEG